VGDRADRRGLARPVGSEQPEDLAAADLEVDPRHRLRTVGAVALVQPLHDDERGVHGHAYPG
jgi:hypothetical protein